MSRTAKKRQTYTFLDRFFEDFEWIHICLGLFGNLTFLTGSVFYLFESLKQAGTWLFIIGAFFMLVGSVGNGLVRYVERHKDNKKKSS